MLTLKNMGYNLCLVLKLNWADVDRRTKNLSNKLLSHFNRLSCRWGRGVVLVIVNFETPCVKIN